MFSCAYGVIKSKFEKQNKMNLANNSSTTNLSRTSMSLRPSAVSAQQQQQRSLPSMERMTLDMLLQPRSNHNHPGDEDSGETVKVRLCSYLQQALDLIDAITIEDKHGGPQMSDLTVCLSPGA
jgi:hypothetical protein